MTIHGPKTARHMIGVKGLKREASESMVTTSKSKKKNNKQSPKKETKDLPTKLNDVVGGEGWSFQKRYAKDVNTTETNKLPVNTT